jgi:hypothetical protein
VPNGDREEAGREAYKKRPPIPQACLWGALLCTLEVLIGTVLGTCKHTIQIISG